MAGKGHEGDVLVCDEDLDGADKVCQRNTLIRLPLLVRIDVVNEDNEVVGVALEMDLALDGAAASHDAGGLGGC